MHRLESRTKALHDHASTLGQRSRGHQLTLKGLKQLDKEVAKRHPVLNVSLEKKYKAMLHIARSIGHSVDGHIPASTVTGRKK